MEGILRHIHGKYQDSITYFRKTVEGIKGLFERDIIEIQGKSRRELLRELIGKTFALLSNFGLHTGTRAGPAEAELAREITVALTSYVSKHLRKKG